jgi:hypothetical protein
MPGIRFARSRSHGPLGRLSDYIEGGATLNGPAPPVDSYAVQVAPMMMRIDIACSTSCRGPGHPVMMSEMTGHRPHCCTLEATAREHGRRR